MGIIGKIQKRRRKQIGAELDGFATTIQPIFKFCFKPTFKPMSEFFLPYISPTLHSAFTKMKMRNIASYQCHIAFCIRRNTLAHELLSAAVGENHELILRMLMQGQYKLRITNMTAQSCHFVRNLSF